MGVTPIPVLRLFFPAGLREFMILAVLFRQESRPSLLFVVVPLMVILVISIVDAVLRCGSGQHGHRRCKRSGQAERSDIVMCTMHQSSPPDPQKNRNAPRQPYPETRISKGIFQPRACAILRSKNRSEDSDESPRLCQKPPFPSFLLTLPTPTSGWRSIRASS